MFTVIELVSIWSNVLGKEVTFYRKVRTDVDVRGWCRPTRPLIYGEIEGLEDFDDE